jgi:hypothetical protein
LPPYLSPAGRVRVRTEEKGELNMPTGERIRSLEPLPRYVMPDGSAPDYDEILEQLQEYHHSHIGSSYFYIRAEHDRTSLCRIIPGGGKLFFHEIIDHEKHGISEADLEHAINRDTGSFSTPGYYPISPHIETKLRVLLDIPYNGAQNRDGFSSTVQ